MSEETGRMSEEDRFLGVKNTVEVPSSNDVQETEEEVGIEVVDDRSEEDQKYAPLDEDGNELKEYGGKVQRRITKLKKEFHDERRAKEQAERMSNEAVNYTGSLQVENQRLLRLVQNSQTALTDQSKGRAAANLSMAQENFKKAHESGDSSEIAEAQQHLTNAQLSQAYAPNVSKKIIDNWKREVMAQERATATQTPYVPETQPIQPDEKAVSWSENNQWFGQDEEMTSFAYGVHQKLVDREGIDPSSDEYYDRIDKRMKQVFPAQFSGGGDSNKVTVNTAGRRKTSPVAGATRNSGSSPRTVTLTQTQVRLAKRLNLTNEQYARQVIKEKENNV